MSNKVRKKEVKALGMEGVWRKRSEMVYRGVKGRRVTGEVRMCERGGVGEYIEERGGRMRQGKDVYRGG